MQVSALHLAALTEVFPVAPADRDAARDALRRIFTAAERVLPGGWGDPSAFIRHIGGCLPRGTAASEGLSALAAEDLALAWGCLLQEPRSLEALNRLLHQAAARVGPTGRAGGAEDDLVQVVWQKLLLGPAPKLAQYKGRGNLSSWLRAVVARAAISAGRGRRTEAAASAELVERAVAAPDPELQYIRQRYREPFRAAFRAAMQTLDPDRRTLIQLHFVNGLSHEEVARAFGVHQTTATRRLAAARQQLERGVREHLKAQLQISTRELESLVRAVRSELAVSLAGLLPASSR